MIAHALNWNFTISVKKTFYTNIQSCIVRPTKVFDLTTYYFKSLTNKSMWLDIDSIKLFYTNITSKLISLN